MTLRHLKIFVAVCDHKTITKASEALYIAQPSVSLAISELEEYYGVRLFDRISRKLYLTKAGEQVLGYARHITALFDEMEKGVKNAEASGIIRVGASVTIGTCLLPFYAQKFENTFPHLSLSATVENSDILEKMVLGNELDLALIEGIPHSDQLIVSPFLDDELLVICAKDNPLGHKKEVSAEELIREPLILREMGSGTRQLFDNAMMLHNLSVKPHWECISTQAILNAVMMNIGISVLPSRLVGSELKAGDLQRIPVKDLQLKRKFSIIYHKNKYLSAALQAFIELCREQTDPLA